MYFDEGDKYSSGKWFVFTVKGILAPSNNWFWTLKLLPMGNSIFAPSEIVSLISEMKWKLYVKAIYWKEFAFLILLMAFFLTEIYWLHYNQVAENTKIIAGNIFHVVMTALLLTFIKTEEKQMSYSTSEYFSSWSNYIDMLFISSMSCYIVANFAL